MKQTTLAILAGGAGSRMGTPKGNLRVNGKPILDWILDRLQWPGPTLLVTAPGVTDPPGHERFDRQAVDPVAGMGPLRGVLTALEHCSTERLCVGTVDMPCIIPAMFDTLIAGLKSRPSVDGIMFRTRFAGGPNIEPFPSAFRTRAKDELVRRLGTGRRSVHGLCDQESYIATETPPACGPVMWTNLNRPGDLAAAQAELDQP